MLQGQPPRARFYAFYAGFTSEINRVLVAVATSTPDSSVMTHSADATRDPDRTTVPVALSEPLLSRMALK
jgi:hypothetical protein